MKQSRDEKHVLNDLTCLATSPGYAHAFSKIVHRDSAVHVKGSLNVSDLDRLFNRERLLRTELTTVMGLMVKKPLDLNSQSPDVIESYIVRTDELLHELHEAMAIPMWKSMNDAVEEGAAPVDPWKGAGMREPIFYGTESAYAFQYRDLAPEKHRKDDDWILKNKGFTSIQAKIIAKAMCDLMNEKGAKIYSDAINSNALPDSFLPVFEFAPQEVALKSAIDIDVVNAFFSALVFGGDNSQFIEVGDFNQVSARPLLPTERGTILLFSPYGIYEALYESPFFWMLEDKAYFPTASKHRGEFTERFAERRLVGVFGREHVYTNVNLLRGKDIVSEADVLVVYGDRLIVVQAKAKKLTIAARKGNDNQLKKDFAAAIQDSYDQGLLCANEMLSHGCRLEDTNGEVVTLPSAVKEVFIFCLVAEHYPALAFQAQQSLKFEITDTINPPLVMDVFFLDTLTEMLATPLRFLSYLKLRVAASKTLWVNHELTALAYHMKQNLWLSGEHDLVMLDDSVAQDLDVAMMVRRDNQLGDTNPPGILTKMRGTHYESLIGEIEKRIDPASLDFGFHLLSLDEETCINVHRALSSIINMSRSDGKLHDVVLASSTPPWGMVFHCNPTSSLEMVSVLEAHCTKRKYWLKAQQCFGVSVDLDGQIQFCISMNSPWENSEKMDQLIADMRSPSNVEDVFPKIAKLGVLHEKIGRNDPCHCGSGRKYKKCCLN